MTEILIYSTHAGIPFPVICLFLRTPHSLNDGTERLKIQV